CYELFGFDVLLDSNLKPWLMEVNISPSLKTSCSVDEGIKSRLVTDLFNMVGFRVKDIELSKRGNSSTKPAPKRQILTQQEKHKHKLYNSKSSSSLSFPLLENLQDDDLKVLRQVEDESHRRGNFERLLPSADDSYLNLFGGGVGYYDALCWQWCRFFNGEPERAVLVLRGIGVDQPYVQISAGETVGVKFDAYEFKRKEALNRQTAEKTGKLRVYARV
ncbi:hypothetical protein HDV05_001402, partial [Chytridiales sp. JEL 0842]